MSKHWQYMHRKLSDSLISIKKQISPPILQHTKYLKYPELKKKWFNPALNPVFEPIL